MKRLPKHLTGPFVNGYYDYKKATIYLKNEAGEWTSTLAYPSFFIDSKNENRFPSDDYGKYIIDRRTEGRFIRMTRDPQMDRDVLRDMIYECKDAGVVLYEADANPVRRWFSDTGAFVAQKFSNLYFDLETDPLVIGFDDKAKRSHRVISFAAYDDAGNSWFYAARESSEKEEEKLLRQFIRVIQDYDVLLAWNGDAYDFFVLRARMKRHGIRLDWRAWNWLDHMLVVKKVLMSISDSDFKRSFALDSIGENVLGIRKIKLSVPPGQMKLLLGERQAELEEYNRRDVEIMLQLEQRKEYLALHYMVCSMCRTFPNHGSIYPNELADGILMRLAIQEGKHFPTRDVWAERSDDKKKYEGAFVMDPVIGFHTNVQVPDFASLYPSIILSWNMSNETILDPDNLPDDFSSETAHATATNVYFRNDVEGIIPRALKRLITKRNEYKARAKNYPVGSEEYKNMTNLSTAVKVVTNSFYGLLGNEGSRFYNKDIARSITLTGQLLIRQVAQYFEHKGLETIYGDTDSIFVKCSEEEMTNEIEYINSQFIPHMLRAVGCKDKDITVKLEYDKGFATLLLITKKRYVGRLSLAKGRRVSSDIEPEVKGLETQRSDQLRYGQELLRTFMKLLIEEGTNPSIIDQMLRDEADQFFTRELSVHELEIAESVKGHPDTYTIPTVAAKVARQMIEEGMEFFPGIKIPYIVLEHKPTIRAIHSSKFDGTCDRVYYWENRILPPIKRLLDVRFPDYPFNNFTSPGQMIIDFDRPTIERRKVRVPSMPKRTIRKPTGKRRRIPRANITIPATERTALIIQLARLLEQYPGEMPLTLHVDTGDALVTIRTEEKISSDGLKEISRLFPALIISPRPI